MARTADGIAVNPAEPTRAAPSSRGRLRWQRPGVALARADQATLAALLRHVREPAGHTADREDRREERARDSEHVEQHRRVELDVRAELPLGPVGVEHSHRGALDRACELEVAAQDPRALE